MSTQISVHRQIIDFFSDTALATRGFRPKISPADARRLKDVLNEDILTHAQLEQIILFFLADRRFRNLGPSIATILSSTVLNGLRNQVINGEQFYKELESYRERYLTKRKVDKQTEKRGPVLLADRLKELSERMASLKTKLKSAPAKKSRAGPVGLFG